MTVSEEKKSEQGKTCTDFVNLIDQITTKKNSIRRDLHIRPGNPLNAMMFKSSDFTGCKAQGGGIYPVTTKSNSQLMNLPTVSATNARLGSQRFIRAKSISLN